ncbi:MAG: PAS domain S-box protein [Candidatus Woesearchaeota archaeon]
MKQNEQIIGGLIGIVFVAAILVMIGWIFGVDTLKSIVPGFVTMKFSTAVAFLIVGLILLGMSNLLDISYLYKGVFFFSTLLLIFMGYMLVTSLLGLTSGIENLVVEEAAGALKTSKPGMPSAATMLNFVLIAVAGLISLSSYKQKGFRIISVIVGLLGVSSVLGYISNSPSLYFYIEGISSAMALHTAFLFVFIGIAIYLLSGLVSEKNNIQIGTEIFLGFFSIVVLMVFMIGLSSQINTQRLENTQMIRDVEAPLELMVEQVRGYDAILTSAAHESLLHAQKGEFNYARQHKVKYDETSAKLDTLLKFNAPKLLAKSFRPQIDKDKVIEILNELDIVNIELVDLEMRAFEAIENKDTESAYSLIVSEQYSESKERLVNLYNEWVAIEIRTTSELRAKIIDESNQLDSLNFYFSIIVVIFALIFSIFMTLSLTRPIKRLENEVIEISKGKLDLQLSKSNLEEVQNLSDSLSRILATMKLAVLRTGLTKAELGFEEIVKAKEEIEKKYKILFDVSQDAIMTIAPPKWNFTSGNPATLKMFNINSEKQLALLNPAELSPERQPDGQLSSAKAKKMIDIAVKKGSNFFEWTHKRYKGENFAANVLLSKVNEDGETYLQATVRDLSNTIIGEQKFKILIESMDDAVYLHGFEPDGKPTNFIDVNSAACKRMGYTRAEFLKMSPMKLDSPKGAKNIPKIMKILLSTGKALFEGEHITKKGKTIPVEINSSILNIAGKKYVLSIARDISGRKSGGYIKLNTNGRTEKYMM